MVNLSTIFLASFSASASGYLRFAGGESGRRPEGGSPARADQPQLSVVGALVRESIL